MDPAPALYMGLAILVGGLWGGLGLALAGQMLGPLTWVGAAASPAIGLVIGLLFRGFRQRGPGIRVALSLVSLYLAAGLFALAVGLADAARAVPDRNGGAVVIQAVLGVWWGITFAGYLPLLWPIAYLTHSLLGRADHSGA